MNVKSFLLDYGEVVPGYDIRVVNDREARAAAGILFMLGMIVIFVGIGYNHIIVAKVYLTFLWFDFIARIFFLKYSPSLLLGKYVVRKQKPEYVGALQKRFAWTLGWMISFPLVYWFVLNWYMDFYKVMFCILCLVLTFFEAAFSICLGCKIYNFITKQSSQYCPGGVCETYQKEPIQTFNPLQAFIAIATLSALILGTYLFLAKTESKTFFGEYLHELVLTDEQLKIEKEEIYNKQLEAEFGDANF